MKTLKDMPITDDIIHGENAVYREKLQQEAINSIKEIESAPSPTDGFVEIDGFMLHKETARTLLKYLNNLEEKDLR